MSRGKNPYEIEWSPTARRALQRVPEKVGTAAIEFIFGPLAENPQRVGRALHFELAGYHSAHRGDYRIIYRIDTEDSVVRILTIEHRGDAYRRR